MTEDNGTADITYVTDADEVPEPDTEHAPNAIGPNCEFGISPAGLIRAAFSAGILMSAFYCDSEAARIIGKQFLQMADKLDDAYEELRRLQEAELAAQTQIQDATVLQDDEAGQSEDVSANLN